MPINHKKNVTFSVNGDTHTNFKLECIRKGVSVSEALELYMAGYANNSKITDFNTFQESTNPFLDQPIEAIEDFIRNLTPNRAEQLMWKCREWLVRLEKR